MTEHYQCHLLHELTPSQLSKLYFQCTDEQGFRPVTEEFITWLSNHLGYKVQINRYGRYELMIGYRRFEEAEAEVVRITLTFLTD